MAFHSNLLASTVLSLFYIILSLSMCCRNPSMVDESNDTQVFGSLKDIDGNIYKTIQIGNQVWMAENLRTTKYNDGTPITLDTSSTNWFKDEQGKYCYLGNTSDSSLIKKYGAYYNYYVIESKKIAPEGWHVPTSKEWDSLTTFLVNNGYALYANAAGNNIAKSLAAKTDWHTSTSIGAIGYDLDKNNNTGFTAFPGGYREEYYGAFNFYGHGAYWWCDWGVDGVASDAKCRCLDDGNNDLNSVKYSMKCGLSIRLLKN